MTFGPVFVIARREGGDGPWRIEGASFAPEFERFHAGDEPAVILECAVRSVTELEPRELSEDEVGADSNVPASGDLPFGHAGDHDPFPPEPEEKPKKQKRARAARERIVL